MRPISPKQHGVVDYLTVATLLGLRRALPAKEPARRVLGVSALAGAVIAPITRHGLGVVGIVPMRVHLAFDAAFAALWLGAGAVLDDEDSAVRGALAGLGAMGAVVALLTNPDG